jgi:hypothetical protein
LQIDASDTPAIPDNSLRCLRRVQAALREIFVSPKQRTLSDKNGQRRVVTTE